ncbi:hypothetical protein KC19_11G124500 [Ceratodon purpureus]|uniref:UBR-type domain-containing protein n=1 Tax=Ceratodon purpureus TaxID=3225 RepID=A0A8T0GEC7_CERPU|nr:hypothetical protein KC19_11G124500 [Ceratodon purpureus]
MAAMEENEDEGVSTLAEYMERVEEQELEADLVLGGDDGKECTYRQGYMKRQAVFSCLTCTPDEEAGFCTACSLACHDGHDVVELWTRRHFRCDCGNSKYGQGICKLRADKDIENSENVYNQNYKGVYCTCHRPYPDPEGAALGEMLQCCICEDWFHELHLGLPPTLQFPRDEEGEPLFDEVICNSCVPKCPFLSKYPDVVIAPATVLDASTDPVEIVEQTHGSGVENGKPSPLGPTTDPKAECSPENGIVDIHQVNSAVGEVSNEAKEEREVKQEVQPSNETAANEDVTNGYHCELGKESPAAIIQPGHPLFLIKSWRAQLCRCPNCLRMYEERGVGFILDSDDTLQAYEASAKRKREETRAQVDGSDLMQGLGHVQQIELLHGFNDMTAQLKNFLAPFGESGRTVTSADIHGFFADLNQKKRRHN